MTNIIDDIYRPMFFKRHFIQESSQSSYCDAGECWKLPSNEGSGYYWVYGQKNLFDIKIHDFYLYEDTMMEFKLPDSLSITYYESISGEELSPYSRLCSGQIKTHITDQNHYKVLVHKNIPIRSIGIEIMPAYYMGYLKKQYPDDYTLTYESFLKLEHIKNFPELLPLMKQLKNYNGSGIAAKLFYESKVTEAVSIIIEKCKHLDQTSESILSMQDIDQMENVTSYIRDHYTCELPLEKLSKIACTGTTKLKKNFKQYHGCSITEYIQQQRISQAEHLLMYSDLTIGQIAASVGYSGAGRFAKLFQKSRGMLPSEFRRLISTQTKK